ncbi:MAG: prepilin-type N-terminal cleavage/methylation domain-containing protein [Bifidobacteriaceae bacterium]|nr:prepilin-type N-terminal cleavage/methylation domain-containing protein [Bifidobacteriaceae bacterium]
MNNWIWRTKEEKDQGFSLVELLIVVIIMGILAAIAIPLFMQQRAKAEDSAAKSDLRNLANEVSTFWADSPTGSSIAITIDAGKYKVVASPAGGTAETSTMAKSKNITAVNVTPGTGQTRENWCVDITNPEGKKTSFALRADDVIQEGVTCSGSGGGATT